MPPTCFHMVQLIVKKSVPQLHSSNSTAFILSRTSPNSFRYSQGCTSATSLDYVVNDYRYHHTVVNRRQKPGPERFERQFGPTASPFIECFSQCLQYQGMFCVVVMPCITSCYLIQALLNIATPVSVLTTHIANMTSTTLSTTIWRLVQDRKGGLEVFAKYIGPNSLSRSHIHKVFLTVANYFSLSALTLGPQS